MEKGGAFLAHWYPSHDHPLLRDHHRAAADGQAATGAGDRSYPAEGVEGLQVVEDTGIMRIQLVFEGKPDAPVRDILKTWGFRWAPSQNAWQRLLNQNGRYAAKMAIEKIAALK